MIQRAPYIFQILHSQVATTAQSTQSTALQVGDRTFFATHIKAFSRVTNGDAGAEFTFRLQELFGNTYLSNAEISSLLFNSANPVELPQVWELPPNTTVVSQATNNDNATADLIIELIGYTEKRIEA